MLGYAQVVYELRELKAPYWYNNDEVAPSRQPSRHQAAQRGMTS